MRLVTLLLVLCSVAVVSAQPKQEIPSFLHSEPTDSMVIVEEDNFAVPIYQYRAEPVVPVAPDSMTVMVQGEMRTIPIYRRKRVANSTSVFGEAENDQQFYPFGIIPRPEPICTRLEMEQEWCFPPPNRVPVLNGLRGAAHVYSRE